MTCIIPGIWIGDSDDAFNLNQLKYNCIHIIINVSNEIRNDFLYHTLYINDSTEDIPKMTQILPNITDIIHDYLKNNKVILVHCTAGSQRSCTLIAAYLMKYKKFTYQKAIDYICKKRNIAFSYGFNVRFKDSLTKFQIHL